MKRLLCLLAFAVLAALVVRPLAAQGFGRSPASDGSYADRSAISAPVLAVEQAVVEAIARAEKSVVAIARIHRPLPGREPPRLAGEPRGPVDPEDPDYVPNDFATGVVIDAAGKIITNYHVLRDPQQSEYYVTLPDRRIYRARVRGADPRSDLAVLEIDARDLTPIALGDAQELRKGQIVITLGNPYAIARDGQVSASWGIVANLGRKAPPEPATEVDPRSSSASEKPTLHHHGTLIQTDAKLNFGTSGGALVNLRGEMVGLTSSIAALAGYESSAGYAIPVDATFRRAIDALKQGKEVDYGFLGVAPRSLRRDERLRGMHGVEVDRVHPSTPAEGLVEALDVVTHVNGEPIYDADGLVREVGKLPADSEVRLTMLRQGRGRPRDVAVRLAKLRVAGEKIVTEPQPTWRGLSVDYHTAALPPNEFPAEPAVTITEVAEGSPAARQGLRAGASITAVDGHRVRTPMEFFAAVEGNEGPVELELFGQEPVTMPADEAAGVDGG